MAISLAEWLDGQADRTSTRQRAQVDTGKLVATFSAGIVATLAATALQVGQLSTWDRVAAALLALSFAMALLVILLDRLTEADQSAVVQISQTQNWPQAKTLAELRVATLTASITNEGVVRSVRLAVAVQVTTSLFGGAAAIISLL
ncbi:MAG: hypothetical protein JXO22_06075 [Phycisphaerae bacterium]|nr:hypothetical protein [Phycisphaerae bacterium]